MRLAMDVVVSAIVLRTCFKTLHCSVISPTWRVAKLLRGRGKR